MFLTDNDYNSHQTAKNLNILTKGDVVSVRNFAESAAEEEMRSYLSARFDTSKIFIDVTAWNTATTYTELSHVYQIVTEDSVTITSIYYANTANIGQNPTGGVSWTLGDLRNPLIVMRMVDMAIYHMFAKIPNRQTPEDVGIRYEEAVKWLQGIAGGKYTPTLPLREVSAAAPSDMQYGFEKRINLR